MKRTIRRLLEDLPFQVFEPLLGKKVLGIYYHVVSDELLPHIRHLYAYKNTRMFRDDLQYLKKRFHLLTYEELVDLNKGVRKAHHRDLVLTFDDGFAQCHSVVRPLLQELEIPCIFFVSTDYIDNRGMSLDLQASLCIEELLRLGDESRKMFRAWQEIFGSTISRETELVNSIKATALAGDDRVTNLTKAIGIDIPRYLQEQKPYITRQQIVEMHQSGFTIGSHSTNHTNLSTLSEAEICSNILNSTAAIRAITGQEQVPFAFPYSAEGISQPMLDALHASNPEVGIFFGGNGMRAQGSVQSRLCGDSPAESKAGRSNLPQFLSKASLEALLASIRR